MKYKKQKKIIAVAKIARREQNLTFCRDIFLSVMAGFAPLSSGLFLDFIKQVSQI